MSDRLSRAAGPFAVFVLAFGFHAFCGLRASQPAGVPLPELSVFFDGHLYIEIAKSFPAPYSPEGRHYLSHAPGYPAWVAMVHGFVPRGPASWGWAAMLAAWSAAAGAAVAFSFVCRQARCPALVGALLFVVANPRWAALASTAHAETLAMLFVVLALLAFQRDRLPASVVFLSLATLCRFPAILIGAPIAFGFLITRQRRDLKTLLWLAAPLLVLALLHLYLFLRVPGFQGLWAEHAVFWDAPLTWPFAKLVEYASPSGWPLPVYWLTYGTVTVCALAIVLGLRRRERALWLLPLWVAALVVFHTSLGGPGRTSASAFSRLIVLAWPAVLLALWRPLGPRLSKPVVVVLLVLLATTSATMAARLSSGAVRVQQKEFYIPIATQRLGDDQPHWLDFSSGSKQPGSGSQEPGWGRLSPRR